MIIKNTNTKFIRQEKNTIPIHWDLMGMDQNNEALIEAIKDKVLWHPFDPNKDINFLYEDTEDMIRGQFGQPFHVEELLKNHSIWESIKQGFYIEAGAAGGELYSNSLYFEIKYNWTGLLVEPSPTWWKELKNKNRNAWILPHCLSTQRSVHLIDFFSFSDSDITDFGFWGRNEMDDEFYRDMKSKHPNDINKIKVQCFPLQAVLKAINSPKVTYFSLDIEGAEYDVLKTLDFDKIDISLLGVEIQGMLPDDVLRKNTGSKEQIHNLLKQNGYIYTDRVELDSFFLKE